jgi:formylglycine-generating enzyme required for sulfatase activity
VKDIADAELKRFPVEQVSWDDCQGFVKLVNDKAQEPSWVYRLPTEAEWEYGCRGGPSINKFDYGFDFYFEKPSLQLQPDQANFNNILKRTCKVGSYQPNKLGLYDMHGNVWEWCDDEMKDAKGASRRVHRGGGLEASSGSCRAALRDAQHPPSHRSEHLGLRLA